MDASLALSQTIKSKVIKLLRDKFTHNCYLTEFSANRVGTRPARGSPENSSAARSHSAITTVGMLSLNSSKITEIGNKR